MYLRERSQKAASSASFIAKSTVEGVDCTTLLLAEFHAAAARGCPKWGYPNLEGRGRPLPSRSRTQRREARLPRSYARLDSRSFADTHMARDGRTDARRTSPRRQKMKAAVFAALATTAAAFAPVARPLAAAAATKLSVVPETVAELPSMLTVRTLCGNQPANRARSIEDAKTPEIRCPHRPCRR